ncbi:MAG TPA: RNase adapter RapZ, partial [Saprospiraceae bacterium]|nr:RNase adapter RapZ [Saprospiraceae bacterium]
DVRFLPNPYFVPALKYRNGTDRLTAEYIMNDPDTRAFMKKTMDLLAFLLPRYRREGRTYLSIAIGCTGGNHRSPAIVEKIARLIGKKFVVNVIHRDIS